MLFQLTNLSIILFITTLFNFFAVAISWQRRKTKNGLYFAWGMAGILFWTLAASLDYAAVPIPLKVFFAKLEYLGYNSALALLALFSLSYTGHDDWLKKGWVKAIFLFVPLSNILLAWTNEQHGLVWSGFGPSEFGNNVVIFEHGPGFVWVNVTGYLMIMVIIGSLWQASRQGSEIARRQGRWLFTASLFPVLSNLIYMLNIREISGVDWSSITFSISGLFFLIALYGARFLDIVPVARHTMIEQMGDPILVLDADNRVVDSNRAAKDVFEFTPGQLGYPIQTVLAGWPEIVALATQKNQGTSSVKIYHKEDAIVFDTRLTLLEDIRGQVLGKLILFRDVSEQDRMEKALREGEERYRTVADYTYDWEYWLGPDGRILYISPSCEIITGFTVDDFTSAPTLMDTIVLPEDRSALTTHKSFALSDKRENLLHEVDFRIRRRDGQVRWIHHLCQNIHDANGASLGLRATNRDITERKSVEDALLESKERYHSLFENMLSGCAYCKMVFEDGQPQDFIYLEVNSAFEELTGLQNVRGKLVSEVIPGIRDTDPRLFEIYGQVSATGISDKFELYLAAMEQWFSVSVYSPKPGYFVAMFDNITGHKRLEESLSHRNKVLAALHQVTINLVNRHNVNDILQTLLSKISSVIDAPQVSIDLVEGSDVLITQAATPGQPLTVGDTMRRGEGGWLSWQAIETGQTAVLEDYSTWPQRRELYEGFPVHAIAIIPIFQDERVIGTINFSRNEPNKPFSALDIEFAQQLAQMTALVLENARLYEKLRSELVERIRSEAALLASEERFRKLIMSAPDAVFGVDTDGKIVLANREATQLLGYSLGELAGKDVEMLIAPDMRERHVTYRTNYIANPRTPALRSGLRLTARHREGSEIPVDIKLSDLETEDGLLVIAFMRDMTHVLQAERQLQQTQEQLLEQQRERAKVEERQRMARDLHDSVNQSVHSMVLFSETLAAALEKNNLERAKQIIERLQESARQSLKETRLLLYELQAPGADGGMDLPGRLEMRLATVERRSGIRAELIQEGLLEHCPPEWQENLFWITIEALNNSLKHAQARKVEIVLRSFEQEFELEVSDNGRGFNPEKVNAGGLGLQNMRDRARLLGGELQVLSTPGKGTRVQFKAKARA